MSSAVAISNNADQHELPFTAVHAGASPTDGAHLHDRQDIVGLRVNKFVILCLCRDVLDVRASFDAVCRAVTII